MQTPEETLLRIEQAFNIRFPARYRDGVIQERLKEKFGQEYTMLPIWRVFMIEKADAFPNSRVRATRAFCIAENGVGDCLCYIPKPGEPTQLSHVVYEHEHEFGQLFPTKYSLSLKKKYLYT